MNKMNKKHKRQKVDIDKEVEPSTDNQPNQQENPNPDTSQIRKKLKLKKKLKKLSKREQKDQDKADEQRKEIIEQQQQKEQIELEQSKIENSAPDIKDDTVDEYQQLKGNESLTAFQLAERKKRMVFVGNIPLSFKPKQLWKVFKSCGKIEKIWFRSIAPKSFITNRANIVKGKMFGDQKNNKNGYILFEQEDSVPKALELNNYTIEDGIEEGQKFTIRVDSETNKQNDFKTTIFVGNLPFIINEEELREHFEPVGKILNIRIVRDKATLIGMGIAFIQFETTEQALKAVRLGVKSYKIKHFKGRQLRIKKAVSNERRERKKERLQQKFSKTNDDNDEADDVDISKLVQPDKPNDIEFHNDVKLKKHRKTKMLKEMMEHNNKSRVRDKSRKLINKKRDFRKKYNERREKRRQHNIKSMKKVMKGHTAPKPK